MLPLGNDMTVADLLRDCEKRGKASPYIIQKDTYREARGPWFGPSEPVKTAPAIYELKNEEVFIVSDLHIAAGRNEAGVYQGTENFFADESFSRFLDFAHEQCGTAGGVLVINGDIFDFLRVTDYPGKVRKVRWVRRVKRRLKFNPIIETQTPEERRICVRDEIVNQCVEWSRELKRLGITRTPEELERDISDREKRYGLGTTAIKTIYKLIRIRHGHPEFFKALAQWLGRGHKLMIVKGNHDLELFWEEVRNYIRLMLADEMARTENPLPAPDALEKIVLKGITFIDDAVALKDQGKEADIYIEHGHRYDKFTMVLGGPKLEKPDDEINLPFGSFFNRYLINRIELFYPFLDNVRPSRNILPMLMRENFPLGMKVLFQHIPLLLRVLRTNFRYVWFMVQRFLPFAVAVGVPLAVGAMMILRLPVVDQISRAAEGSGILPFLLKQAAGVGMAAISYILARVVAWFQLTEPESLESFVPRFLQDGYRIITMGHTHNPGEYLFDGTVRFYNTGTWIPVVETSNADVREDKAYTFLHLTRDANGMLQPAEPGFLQRWNDDAGRADIQVLMRRK